MDKKLKNTLEEIIPLMKEKLKERLRLRSPSQERVKEVIRVSYQEETNRIYIYRAYDDTQDRIPNTGKLIRLEMSDREDKDQEPFVALFMPDELRDGKKDIDAWGITYSDTDEEIMIRHFVEYLLDNMKVEDLTEN